MDYLIVSLPSGSTAVVALSVTYGDLLFIAGLLGMLALFTYDVILFVADMVARK